MLRIHFELIKHAYIYEQNITIIIQDFKAGTELFLDNHSFLNYISL